MDAFAFQMTNEDLEKMNIYEEVPTFYTLVDVELVKRDGEKVNGKVYLMNPSELFEFPDEKYLQG